MPVKQPFDLGLRSHPITGQLRLQPRSVGVKAAIGTGAVIYSLAAAPSAEAAPYWFWSDHLSPSYEVIQPAPRRLHQKRPPRHDTKLEKQLEQPTSKPRGPLVIAISIDQQNLRLYDANGLFAETPVSTGMRGHATPLGVFSVIQKRKYHRSNIYSGAPMPYMQRITWSGIALHAGVLPGYPASHGCIRMPMAFATKLWGWTRMGARVVVTAGDVTPASFSHPLLIAASTPSSGAEAPLASETPQPVKAGKADKAAADSPPDQQLAADTALRPGIALEESMPPKPAAQIRTAAARAGTETLTDASPDRPSAAILATSNASPAGAPEAVPNAGDSAVPAKSVSSGGDLAAASAGSPAAAGGAEATGTVDASQPAGPAAKDQSRVSDLEPSKPTLPVPKPDAQIAVFISGKDGKLYVRQNQTPLFDVPVTITPAERPLGTHVFTAEKDKDNAIRWTAMSLPAARSPAKTSEQTKSRLRKNNLAEDVKAKPESETAAGALDRLTIPPEAMARIAMAISTGSSLIVSDQGIATGETGEGTDFIIPLR